MMHLSDYFGKDCCSRDCLDVEEVGNNSIGNNKKERNNKNGEKMSSRNEELVKNSLLLSLGTLIPKALTFIVLPILTGYLTKEEYGNYDLILSAVALIVPIVTLQIHQAAFRFLIGAKDDRQRQSYTISSLLFILGISIITYPINFCIFKYALNFSTQIANFVCLVVFSESLYMLVGQALRGLGNNLKYSVCVIIYSVVNFLSILLMIYYLRLGLSGIVLSVVLSYLFASLFGLICISKIMRFDYSKFSLTSLFEMIKFSAPILPSSISLWIVNLSDRIIIIAVLGASINGIYSVANKIPVLYSTAYGIFNLAWYETASRVSDTDNNPALYYSNLFKMLFDFLVGVMLLVISVSPLIYKYLINEQYYSSYYQTAILFFGAFFNSLVAYYAGIYIALKRTKQVGISSIFGAVLNLVINILLIHSIGLYAASISTALSYLIILLYRACDINKVIKLKYDIKRIAVGILFFFVSVILFFQRTVSATACCMALAIIYNAMYNRYMIAWVLKKLNK